MIAKRIAAQRAAAAAAAATEAEESRVQANVPPDEPQSAGDDGDCGSGNEAGQESCSAAPAEVVSFQVKAPAPAGECGLCNKQIEAIRFAKTLPCSSMHVFHFECIDEHHRAGLGGSMDLKCPTCDEVVRKSVATLAEERRLAREKAREAAAEKAKQEAADEVAKADRPATLMRDSRAAARKRSGSAIRSLARAAQNQPPPRDRNE
mmetsp:Transcript_56763/g.130560  ORF Transcript_56763/g.130560 Transcript_56763/m.130560 type:complete len:206 (-) Transcript_56763:27-644(-)